VKSDYYWGRDRVKTRVIDALAVPSQVTMFNLYETDKADWIPDAPTIALRELLKPSSHRTDLDPMPYMGTYFYACNLQHKPLNDVRVRKALALAIDRDEITKTATGAGEIPAYSFVPPGAPDYKAATCGEENVKEARRLLAEAGFANGEGFPKLEILYNSHEAHQAIAQLIRKQWERNLGIEVTTRNEEWGSYQNSFRAFEYDVARRAWIGDYVDPNTFLDCMVTNGENNCTGWSNAEYDKLIAAARSEVDEAKRMKLLERAERILMDELPVIPIYYYVDKNLVKPYVRGFYRNALDNHPLSAIWIDREQQLRDELKSN
jgi:oligopeptide transport system substrate-binding protein